MTEITHWSWRINWPIRNRLSRFLATRTFLAAVLVCMNAGTRDIIAPLSRCFPVISINVCIISWIQYQWALKKLINYNSDISEAIEISKLRYSSLWYHDLICYIIYDVQLVTSSSPCNLQLYLRVNLTSTQRLGARSDITSVAGSKSTGVYQK